MLGRKGQNSRAIAFASAIAASTALARPAEAITFTWDTCASFPFSSCTFGLGASHLTSHGSGTGRYFAFDALEDPSQTLLVGAVQTSTNLGTGPLVGGYIHAYNGGLGIGNEGVPQHAVDNIGPDEMLVFVFPDDGYTPLSFSIGYRDGDADISTFIGGVLDSPDLIAFILGSGSWNASGGLLTSQFGFVQQTFLDVVPGVPQVFTGGAAGRFLVIAARNETAPCLATYGGWKKDKQDHVCDAGNDTFKVEQVVADPAHDAPSVPEPGGLVFLGAGLMVLELRRRAVRRQTHRRSS